MDPRTESFLHTLKVLKRFGSNHFIIVLKGAMIDEESKGSTFTLKTKLPSIMNIECLQLNLSVPRGTFLELEGLIFGIFNQGGF